MSRVSLSFHHPFGDLGLGLVGQDGDPVAAVRQARAPVLPLAAGGLSRPHPAGTPSGHAAQRMNPVNR